MPRTSGPLTFEQAFRDIVKGGGDTCGLTLDHLERVENEEECPEGWTFEVERHPNIFGRPSKGKPSSAFATIATSYKLTVGQGFEITASEVKSFDFNLDVLVDEEMNSLSDSNKIDELLKFSGAELEEEAQEVASTVGEELKSRVLMSELPSPEAHANNLFETFVPVFSAAIVKKVETQRDY